MTTVRRFSAPDIGFGFAWDAESLRLYIIHENGKTHMQIASNVRSPEIAEVMVAMWCRGYRAHKHEAGLNKDLRHHVVFLETGYLGVKGPKAITVRVDDGLPVIDGD